MSSIANILPRPQNHAEMVVRFHNTSDIITQIKRAHAQNAQYAKLYAHKFKRGNTRSTARAIFDHLKNNVRYIVEPAHRQTTKSIPRLLADGHGDCKHYSGFIASALDVLNIPFKYRFVSFKQNNPTPTHVYVVAYDENGKEIIIDAVLPFFDTEKPFAHKKDLTMPLYHLSGIDEIESFIGRRKPIRKAARRVTQAVRKETKKAANIVRASAKRTGKAVKKVAKKVVPGAKTIGLAPARAAYLTLVSLNVRGLATSLSRGNQDAIKRRWNQLGGNFTKLQKAIRTGSKKRAVLSGVDETIGAVSIATALATAAPVIVAMATVTGAGKNLAAEARSLFKRETGQDVENTPVSPQPEAGSNFANAVKDLVRTTADVRRGGPAATDSGATQSEAVEQPGTSSSLLKNPVLLLALAAGVILVISRKK